MRVQSFVLAFGASMISTLAFASSDQKVSEFVLCKHDKAVRSIRVTPGDGKDAYTVTYSKNGVDEVMGNNRSKTASQSILNQIEDHLKGSDWNCRQVGKATVTSSAEAIQQ